MIGVIVHRTYMSIHGPFKIVYRQQMFIHGLHHTRSDIVVCLRKFGSGSHASPMGKASSSSSRVLGAAQPFGVSEQHYLCAFFFFVLGVRARLAGFVLLFGVCCFLIVFGFSCSPLHPTTKARAIGCWFVFDGPKHDTNVGVVLIFWPKHRNRN